MFKVTILREFAGAHRVEDYPGNCERLHGHNWKIEVSTKNKNLDNLSMVVDFRKLKDATDKVLSRLDHTYLNENPDFGKRNPTAENIARYLFNEISKEIKISSVKVYETDSSIAEYEEDCE